MRLNHLTIIVVVIHLFAATASAQEAQEGDLDPSSEHFPRFRWGISGGGGPFVGGTSGGVGGIHVRLGAQISDMFGVAGQPVALVGAGVSSSNTTASASALGLVGVGVLAEFTFIDFFYAGIGPELLYGGLADTSSSVVGSSASASGGAFFGFAMRAGLALGSPRPESRKAFTIGLDMHIIFAGDVVVTPMLFLGFDKF